MTPFVRKHRKTIELGRAIERAVEEGFPVTKAEIGKILAVLSKIPLDGVDSSKLIFWHHVGSRNPKPLMDELIRWINALGEWSDLMLIRP